MSEKVQKILDMLAELTLLEASELKKAMEEKFGVSAAAPMMMAAAPAASAAPVEEKTSFDVELTAAGEKKIDVIKLVKNYTGLGLAEAKALVEAAPKMVKEQVAKADAETWKKELEAAGAKVTLK